MKKIVILTLCMAIFSGAFAQTPPAEETFESGHANPDGWTLTNAINSNFAPIDGHWSFSGDIAISSFLPSLTSPSWNASGALTVSFDYKYSNIVSSNKNITLSAVLVVGSNTYTIGTINITSANASGTFIATLDQTAFPQTGASGKLKITTTIGNISLFQNANLKLDNVVVTTMNALPVKMSALFVSRNSNGSINVSWTTYEETNNARFDVQVSADGVNWTTVHSVSSKAPNGNSGSPIPYDIQLWYGTKQSY